MPNYEHLEAPAFTLIRALLYNSDDDISNGQESLISEDNEEINAEAARESVADWRQRHHLQNDSDFALTYSSFEDAHLDTRRAVAMAWSRCHQKSWLEGPRPWLPPWPSMVSLADRIVACDDFKKQGKYHPSDAEGGYKLLRFWIRWRTYPNREILDSAYHTGNRRFLQPLIKLMSENKLLEQSNSKSSAIGYNFTILLRIPTEELYTYPKTVFVPESRY